MQFTTFEWSDDGESQSTGLEGSLGIKLGWAKDVNKGRKFLFISVSVHLFGNHIM